MRWTESDREKMRRLLMQEGWEVLTRWMEEFKKECARDLAVKGFDNLLEVGRLQGQITAIERLQEVVKRRGAPE